MKLLILTAAEQTLKWKSLPTKLLTIKNTLNSAKNADWEVEIKYVPVTPLVINNRIDHSYLFNLFVPYFNNGYDVISLHLSSKQWKELGLKPGLRGANPKRKGDLLLYCR
jgi:hypothetical protein